MVVVVLGLVSGSLIGLFLLFMVNISSVVGCVVLVLCDIR